MLRIRLSRVGKKKQPSYRLVVADSRAPRDGAFIKIIGHYNPRTDPVTLVVKEDEAVEWLTRGAQPSDTVAKLLTRIGVMERAGRAPVVWDRKTPVKPKKAAEEEAPGAAPAAAKEETPAKAEAPADEAKAEANAEAPAEEAKAEAEAAPEAPAEKATPKGKAAAASKAKADAPADEAKADAEAAPEAPAEKAAPKKGKPAAARKAKAKADAPADEAKAEADAEPAAEASEQKTKAEGEPPGKSKSTE